MCVCARVFTGFFERGSLLRFGTCGKPYTPKHQILRVYRVWALDPTPRAKHSKVWRGLRVQGCRAPTDGFREWFRKR